jgi:hypothetical protein
MSSRQRIPTVSETWVKWWVVYSTKQAKLSRRKGVEYQTCSPVALFSKVLDECARKFLKLMVKRQISRQIFVTFLLTNHLQSSSLQDVLLLITVAVMVLGAVELSKGFSVTVTGKGRWACRPNDNHIRTFDLFIVTAKN